MSNVNPGLQGTSRPVGRGDKVAEFAEKVAFYMFAFDFIRRYRTGIVFQQDENLAQLNWQPTRRSAPSWTSRLMVWSTASGNLYSKGKRNRQLMKGGSKKQGYVTLRPGRARKADGLGLAVHAQTKRITCELLEVTTEGEASTTMIDDLKTKLDSLNGMVKQKVDQGIDELLSNSSSEFRGYDESQGFHASGTSFIPPEMMHIWPMPNSIAYAGLASPRSSGSACLWPTCDYRPCANPYLEDEKAPARGLVLYKVYRAKASRDAIAMTERMKDIVRRLGFPRALGPELLPVAATYWKSNTTDLNLWIALGAFAIALALTAFMPVLAPVTTEILITSAPIVLGATAAFVLVPDVARTMVSEYEALTRAVYTIHKSAYVTAGRTPPAFFGG